jgi:hypothetical protein
MVGYSLSMLTLLLLACSTTSGPPDPESPTAKSAEAIEQAAKAATQIEAVSHVIAFKTRAEIDRRVRDEPSSLDLSNDLEALKKEIQSIEDNLDQAAKMLALVPDWR